MEYRRLGRTDLQVGAVGLGTEYLLGRPREVVADTLDTAISGGANLVDLLFSIPGYLDDVAAAIGDRRDDLILAAHWGSGESNGQACNVRSREECDAYFCAVLDRMGTIDVLFLHMVDTPWEYETWFHEMLPLAQRYRDECRVQWIGMSSHKPAVAQRAVESGAIDVLMFPVNLAGHALEGRQELLAACVREDVGLVAMKPYAGGALLAPSESVFLHWVHSGGASMELTKAPAVTPTQCLSYTLAQTGVSTVIPGARDAAQMRAALDALDAPPTECDWTSVVKHFHRYTAGQCVYCNHCLPCPVSIDIGEMMRLTDSAAPEPGVTRGVTPELRTAYNAHAATAADCIECGACSERCPFEVDVVERMRYAAELFA